MRPLPRATVACLFLVAMAQRLAGQSAGAIVFEEAKGVRCELPAGLPCAAWDADSKPWCLYRRTGETGDELVLTRERAVVPETIPGAQRGAVVPLDSGNTLLVVWESPQDGTSVGIRARELATGRRQWSADPVELAAPPCIRLDGVGVTAEGTIAVVYRTGDKPGPAPTGSSIHLRLRPADARSWTAPVPVARGLDVRQVALACGKDLVAIAYATADAHVFVRPYWVSRGEFIDPVGSPAGNREPFVLAPGKRFAFSVSDPWLYLGFEDAAAPGKPMLAIGDVSPRPRWTRWRQDDQASEQPLVASTFELLPLGDGHALLLWSEQSKQGSSIRYAEAAPPDWCPDHDELKQLQRQTIDAITPCGFAGGRPAIAVQSRSASGQARGQVFGFQAQVRQLPGLYGLRDPAARERVNRTTGVATTSIAAGLRWLSKHQDDSGCWDSDGFMKHDTDGAVCDGAGKPIHDVGLTGLALLAFLGDGNTWENGPFRDVVRKGIDWLLEQQQEENGLVGLPSTNKYVYGHAIATQALCEAYALSRHYPPLKRPAQMALNFIAQARNPYGVWRYQPRDNDGDTSVTGWMTQALLAGRESGLEIDKAALTNATVWFDAITDPVTGQAGYTKAGEGSSRTEAMMARFPNAKTEAMTAMALFCRTMLGQDPKESKTMDLATESILHMPPQWNPTDGSIDMYYWYFATCALYQMGGRPWDTWWKKLTEAVVKTQRRDGNFLGSWDPVDPWGQEGGRIYATAILVLALQSEHRFQRVRKLK